MLATRLSVTKTVFGSTEMAAILELVKYVQRESVYTLYTQKSKKTELIYIHRIFIKKNIMGGSCQHYRLKINSPFVNVLGLTQANHRGLSFVAHFSLHMKKQLVRGICYTIIFGNISLLENFPSPCCPSIRTLLPVNTASSILSIVDISRNFVCKHSTYSAQETKTNEIATGGHVDRGGCL